MVEAMENKSIVIKIAEVFWRSAFTDPLEAPAMLVWLFFLPLTLPKPPFPVQHYITFTYQGSYTGLLQEIHW